MGKRNQRRQKAILPLKITLNADGKGHLAHTLDISASGARLVLTTQVPVNTPVSLEFKRRRVSGVVVWCKPVKGSKFDHEIGLRLLDSGTSFWGVALPMKEYDVEPNELEPIPYEKVASMLSKPA